MSYKAENIIWDKARWMCDLGISEEDAKKYTIGSSKKINIICPHCGRINNKRIGDVYRNRSIGCICSDKRSYPEKFMYSILEQLNVKFITQYSPDYLLLNNSRKYSDFYIPDYNLIIETDGLLGHKGGKSHSKSSKTLDESIEIDNWKDEQHKKHGLKTIRINCFKSDMEYIKNSIFNSELINIFDLSCINWFECDKFSICTNIIKSVCDYYNTNSNINKTEIADHFNLCLNTICKYLKKGNEFGWCKYDPKESLSERSRKLGIKNSFKVRIFKDGVLIGEEYSATELERVSIEKYGVYLSQSKISLVCNGKKPQYKGFTFKYII